ncbi:MAG: B12-binding domain-containing radical SAM protein [Geobacteraceae bacterium]|nr:B12-binding domain-containing radical SAM protein [Geobacteraceae bacterium]
MKILLLYPNNPDTFWSFRHALKFISKKACYPPLGLLTVAAMLPESWEKRLVDMNTQTLSDKELQWADYVFLSAMTIQRDSVKKLLTRCRQLGVCTVAGGPLFTTSPAEFDDVDHLVLNEAEITLPPFLEDLQRGHARHLYTSECRAELKDTPVPLWELIDAKKYAAMNIQYSRGCPFDCEFCDITALFGRVPRTKTTEQLLEELESLYVAGWRGGVFFVDDNFIGDRKKLKNDILPALIQWMTSRGHPFSFITEASINLADDEELLEMMVTAGFEEVFIGIETPSEEGHQESGKEQNKNRDLLDCVKRIQKSGLQVQAGFIVGFDSDSPTIFERQIRFIQESGIATAMVGMLTALSGTKLYQRLVREGRMLEDASGNNTSIATNFVPKMKMEVLVNGYRTIIDTIYAPKNYYRRVITFLKDYQPLQRGGIHLKPGYLGALFKSMLILGFLGKERFQYWKLFFWSLFRRPRLFPTAITLAIYGFHFRKIAEKISYSPR